MKKAIAEKWVKALRSKKYKQAKSVLKIKNKSGGVRHCCLGVLCELYQQDMRKQKRKPLHVSLNNAHGYDEDLPKTSQIYDFNGDVAHLPERVRKWAGMRTDNGDLNNEIIEVANSPCWDLVSLNDNGGSFKKIAAVIEARVKEL